ncbi:diguanylate cyclase domain-containing protein [Mycolicibacterium austroafricanum]|uniref:diguanylate cyclase domain-containing protein n=1 Tax=Mycolicibacterium austroafricanum TaxID=39687 RepID=UPI001F471F11|nr:diguanylate cyclase [Mycolicibacterium austroafricanum]
MFLTFPLVYAVSIVLGRSTRLGGSEVSLVWPAAAVAITWLLAVQRCDRWQRAIHMLVLGVVTFVMNLATDAPLPLSAWFVTVNLALALVTVGILRYRRDEVILRDPADLARVVVAVAAGTMCAAALATAYLVPATGAPVWETFGLFTARNGATALIGVTAWLRLREVRWTRPRLSLAAIVETIVTAGVVGFSFVWIFWLSTGIPLGFLVLLPAMWVALRYSTTVSTVFLLVAAGWIIYSTLSDRGAFIVPDMQLRALLAQAMVFSLTVLVLALALFRDSRMRLIGQLKTARDRADADSELLGAVLDSIHDSVVLADQDGRVVLQNAQATDSGLVGDVVSVVHTAGPVDDMAESASHTPRDIVVSVEDARILELATTPLPRQPRLCVMAFRDVTEERRNARELREARDLFAGVLDAASEQAIIGTDPSGCITVFNNGAERLLGWTEEEMLGRAPMDFHYPPEVRARAEELGVPEGFEVFVHNVTPDAAEIREWTYVRRDGGHVDVSLAVSVMTDEGGTRVGYIGVATDITERKAAERALAESEERFRLAFDTAPVGMFMFDVTAEGAGCITRCNQTLGDFLGRPTADVLGMSVTELGSNESISATVGLTELPALRKGESWGAEVAFRRADGATVWGAVSASLVAPPGADPYGICLIEDVTARKRAEAELQYLVLHDPLTGLANRALLLDRIEHALADIDRHDSCRVGLLFMDLDGFKPVNDTWGHAAGDEILKTVARRIQNCIRPGDTAARLGGDEFAVLCPVVAGYEPLRGVAERIWTELRRPIVLTIGEIYDDLSVSIGVTTSDSGSIADEFLHRADQLMYHAKRHGKDCIIDDETSAMTSTAVGADGFEPPTAGV